ncbi:MAG TPA: ABC transporter substrate-binding protein [Gammaproteobacteria bacterium]|jgi:peptide/nickel transport system substrate-binding protein|nr:ABC transporter substrate-binding protein [Gammaproteobacteria bacterium]
MKKSRDPIEHAAMPGLKDDLQEGRITRRDFLRYATLLGVSTTAAYKLANKVNTGEPLLIPIARAGSMPKGGTLRISMRVQEIHSPHTFAWLSESNIFRGTNEYLTYTDYQNVTRPALVESWSVSDDIRTWTLNLRKWKWHSGRDFTADDVIWNIKRCLDPATGSSVLGLMKGYMMDDAGENLWDANALEKVDDHTVNMNLKTANVAIPEHLFHYPMAIIDPDEGGKYGAGSNGTNVFDLVEFKLGEKAVLKARKGAQHWNGGPHLDAIEWIDLGDDYSAQLAAFASGQVHGAYDAPVGQMDAYAQMPGLRNMDVATAGTGVLRGQVDEAPFNDPRVRKAMRLAVDSRQALEVAQRGVGVAGEHHHVCPIHPDYHELPFMARDVEAAKALLTEAGYPNGIEIGGIACKKDPPWELAAVEVMVEQLKDAGIRAEINLLPSSEFWGIWDKTRLGFTSWAHRPLGFMVLGLAYRSGVPWNESHFNDAEFDETLTQAEGIPDARERSKLIGKLETIMQERGPIVQPIWLGRYTPWHENVLGYNAHPTLYIFGHELALKS